jgi:hypothetical protein
VISGDDGFSQYCERLADGFVGDRLDVGLLQGDEFVCKQPQRPAVAAVRRIATG